MGCHYRWWFDLALKAYRFLDTWQTLVTSERVSWLVIADACRRIKRSLHHGRIMVKGRMIA